MQPTEQLKTLYPQPPESSFGPTTAWRIYHDAASGVWIDHFDGRWLVQTKAGTFPDFVRRLGEGVARSIYWRPRDKAAATAPVRVAGEEVNERFTVQENGAAFLIDFDSGYSSGVFLDQRLNRNWVRENVVTGQRILNTFAYTGGFSVVAALAEGITTTCDLSKGYLEWTWENFRVNGLEPDDHFGVKGDAFDWMRSFDRQGRQFDGVILDPPTFSRSGKKSFRTDRDYANLAGLAASLVTEGGWILACANTHRWETKRFVKDVSEGIRKAGRDVGTIVVEPMPPEFHGDDYLKTVRVVVG